MARIQFTDKNFSKKSLIIIEQANEIIAAYQADDLKLTLRQLYYQFVSRDLIPNKQTEYDRLGSIINEARLAGLIDWEAIEDRGRNLLSVSTWDEPSDIIRSAAYSYKIDLWEDQPNRVEVWIEKQALEGVIAGICNKNRVPYFSCKGYVSQSEMWAAGYLRFKRYIRNGQEPIIIHLGDHDPSGIDMTRDIEDRLSLFAGGSIEIRRIALNFDQVKRYNPPPNPAKVSDSRFASYQAAHGDESWELDALEPKILTALIQKEIGTIREQEKWDARAEIEREQIAGLNKISTNYEEVTEFLQNI
jgi:hypothetical protein